METPVLWLFRRQFSALFYKNIMLSLRRKRSTIIHFSSAFLFVLLIFGVDQAIQASRRGTTSYRDVKSPPATAISPIVPCETGYFMRDPCYDFVWSGNSSATAARIVLEILRNNPGRPIPPSKTLGFATPDDVDRWLLAHPLQCPGALHLEERQPNVIAYGIQTNSTAKIIRGTFEDTVFKFQLPLQAAAEREISRFLTRDPSLGWNVSFAEYPHPARTTFSTVGTIGPTFLLAATMFGFVIQLSNLVSEKELKLRQAMSVMGLMDSVYWSTWLIWDVCLTFLSSMVLVLSGMMFQFNFFLDNDFGVLFLVFFLFQTNMVAFSFLLSTFVTKTSSANTVGFVVFIVGFVTQLVTAFGFPYSNSYSKLYQIIWSFFPPNIFAAGMSDLGKASSESSGYTWAGRNRCPPRDNETDCVLTLEQGYYWLIGTFFLWLVLAIYFDNVLPDVNGVRKPWFYFTHASYWTGNMNEKETTGCCGRKILPSPPPGTATDDDVKAEEDSVKQNDVDPLIAVQVRGLVKTFSGSRKKAGCCRWRRVPPQHAVQGCWFSIENQKLFCLLGANGAGKTTTINCLTGILPVTAGDAYVYGESIKSTHGMNRIRSYMGVCPQFDILWGSLTGREHLHIFAKIKGIDQTKQREKVEEMLAKVKLTEAGNTRSDSYSGGMKRRLSVAISLVGDPKVLYLDEPTTGMDPIMRRHVWDVIEDAKKNCAIILTTHSMEEADVLADRIAIMAKGKLQCIGSSIHLKSKYGTGYKISVGVENGFSGSAAEVEEEERVKRAGIKAYFHEHLNLAPCEETKAYVTFAVPQSQPKLADFFEELSYKSKELGITDIQLGLTTLEDVFLNIAKRAELQNSEGRLEQLRLSDGMVLMVPVGTRYFPVPGTVTEDHPLGMMVEIFWQQDENGSLCIRDFSELRPAPETLAMDQARLSSVIRNILE
ncbi:ABC transporter A family member 2 [Selaginella moellendorffii]|uniref:ABC transporter A family member 2 n=1 Tax=Selaginella moellendorffii TaxID=88036 RepID=UPI000D1CF355|nr:ABC transporter A family member 2 [Selaginella moellendorffii]|eukprot:XP_024541685.1 ABC transporter A family member 2 [Selaginella moellendorffii]